MPLKRGVVPQTSTSPHNDATLKVAEALVQGRAQICSSCGPTRSLELAAANTRSMTRMLATASAGGSGRRRGRGRAVEDRGPERVGLHSVRVRDGEPDHLAPRDVRRRENAPAKTLGCHDPAP
jgi:hypothetical protein